MPLTKTSDLPKPAQAKIDAIVDALHDIKGNVRAALNDDALPEDSHAFAELNQLEDILSAAQRIATAAARN